MRESVSCDYLVIGAGATGMAFVDVILEMTDASVVMVDEHARPGGHWNDAYPFVRLHQPSAFYGVTSRPLGNDAIDSHGTNKGLYELASGSEVVTYFEQVMDQTFLPSGRVKYFPMSRYRFDGSFESRLSGEVTKVSCRTLVDARFVTISVPSTTPPPFEVGANVRCVPPNDLPDCEDPAGGFVVVGAGKTAIDTCLFLLDKGADPNQIKWVRPRDPWLSNRENFQPGLEFASQLVHRAFTLANGAATATSIDEMYDSFERAGVMLRIDAEVRPSMWRCASVTEADIEQLRRITDVVRLGHVRRLTSTEMVLEEGSVALTDAVFVDCTANGLAGHEPVDIFDGDTIRIQPVKGCQPVFSAAVIGFVEAHYAAESEKNDLCRVVPYPSTDRDWLWFYKMTGRNAARWREEPELAEWLSTMRLNLARPPKDIEDPKLLAKMVDVAGLGPAARENAERLLAETPG